MSIASCSSPCSPVLLSPASVSGPPPLLAAQHGSSNNAQNAGATSNMDHKAKNLNFMLSRVKEKMAVLQSDHAELQESYNELLLAHSKLEKQHSALSERTRKREDQFTQQLNAAQAANRELEEQNSVRLNKLKADSQRAASVAQSALQSEIVELQHALHNCQLSAQQAQHTHEEERQKARDDNAALNARLHSLEVDVEQCRSELRSESSERIKWSRCYYEKSKDYDQLAAKCRIVEKQNTNLSDSESSLNSKVIKLTNDNLKWYARYNAATTLLLTYRRDSRRYRKLLIWGSIAFWMFQWRIKKKLKLIYEKLSESIGEAVEPQIHKRKSAQLKQPAKEVQQQLQLHADSDTAERESEKDASSKPVISSSSPVPVSTDPVQVGVPPSVEHKHSHEEPSLIPPRSLLSPQSRRTSSISMLFPSNNVYSRFPSSSHSLSDREFDALISELGLKGDLPAAANCHHIAQLIEDKICAFRPILAELRLDITASKESTEGMFQRTLQLSRKLINLNKKNEKLQREKEKMKEDFEKQKEKGWFSYKRGNGAQSSVKPRERSKSMMVVEEELLIVAEPHKKSEDMEKLKEGDEKELEWQHAMELELKEEEEEEEEQHSHSQSHSQSQSRSHSAVGSSSPPSRVRSIPVCVVPPPSAPPPPSHPGLPPVNGRPLPWQRGLELGPPLPQHLLDIQAREREVHRKARKEQLKREKQSQQEKKEAMTVARAKSTSPAPSSHSRSIAQHLSTHHSNYTGEDSHLSNVPHHSSSSGVSSHPSSPPEFSIAPSPSSSPRSRVVERARSSGWSSGSPVPPSSAAGAAAAAAPVPNPPRAPNPYAEHRRAQPQHPLAISAHATRKKRAPATVADKSSAQVHILSKSSPGPVASSSLDSSVSPSHAPVRVESQRSAPGHAPSGDSNNAASVNSRPLLPQVLPPPTPMQPHPQPPPSHVGTHSHTHSHSHSHSHSHAHAHAHASQPPPDDSFPAPFSSSSVSSAPPHDMSQTLQFSSEPLGAHVPLRPVNGPFQLHPDQWQAQQANHQNQSQVM